MQMFMDMVVWGSGWPVLFHALEEAIFFYLQIVKYELNGSVADNSRFGMVTLRRDKKLINE